MNVLITGAGRGIGRAIALRFARGGANVVLMARSQSEVEEGAREIERNGSRALAISCDVADYSQVENAVNQGQSTLGAIDVAINNAGSFDCIGPIAEIDPEVWWRDCEINLRGPLHVCRAVLPGMIENKSGTIINMSGGGAGNPFPFGSGYASSKAALVRLTECLAKEVEESGILAFGMGPGFVRTRMTEFQAQSESGQRWIPSSKEALDAGRDSPPEPAAELAFQLAARREELAPLTGRMFNAGENLDETIARIPDILATNARTLRYA